ncbi:MAG: type II toxin-antitoxin system HigB family toxin [gamma proteobacterium endosymbiont of Lamellibrachia anaximandri]|nr:type II toxin-antitoxin system HigB family toxin [gamma proteobacterium endosymbiont of Lamellibrachia anaximandri]MBL3619740.1 type II toxin-antitoxin system HigB family toxin [gamma proteobacterium endosymbiont of Lamellibrachia anaximandri]
MHIITRRRLLEFAEKHPNTSAPLDVWYRIVKQSKISNFSQLREIFPSVDKVDNLTVFNIGGNKIRLIAAVHYNTQCLYIRHVLTHKEYDKEKWKKS